MSGTRQLEEKEEESPHVTLILSDISGGMLRQVLSSANVQVDGLWLALVQVFGKIYCFHFGGILVLPADSEEGSRVTRVIEFEETTRTEAELNAWLNSPEIKAKYAKGKYKLRTNNSNHFADQMLREFFGFNNGVPEYAMNQTDNMAQAGRDFFQNLRLAFGAAARTVEPELQEIRQNLNEVRGAVQTEVLDAAENVTARAAGAANEVRQVVQDIVEETGEDGRAARDGAEDAMRGLMRALQSHGVIRNGMRHIVGEIERAQQRAQQGNRQGQGRCNPQRVQNDTRRGRGRGRGRGGRGGHRHGHGHGGRGRGNRRGQGASLDNMNAPLRAGNDALEHRVSNNSVPMNANNSGGSSDGVPLRRDMLEFIENAFPEKDESAVAEKIKALLRKEGYSQLSELSSTSEEELLSMGFKRGWAKRVVSALDNHFN